MYVFVATEHPHTHGAPDWGGNCFSADRIQELRVSVLYIGLLRMVIGHVRSGCAQSVCNHPDLLYVAVTQLVAWETDDEDIFESDIGADCSVGL